MEHKLYHYKYKDNPREWYLIKTGSQYKDIETNKFIMFRKSATVKPVEIKLKDLPMRLQIRLMEDFPSEYAAINEKETIAEAIAKSNPFTDPTTSLPTFYKYPNGNAYYIISEYLEDGGIILKHLLSGDKYPSHPNRVVEVEWPNIPASYQKDIIAYNADIKNIISKMKGEAYHFSASMADEGTPELDHLPHWLKFDNYERKFLAGLDPVPVEDEQKKGRVERGRVERKASKWNWDEYEEPKTLHNLLGLSRASHEIMAKYGTISMRSRRSGMNHMIQSMNINYSEAFDKMKELYGNFHIEVPTGFGKTSLTKAGLLKMIYGTKGESITSIEDHDDLLLI